MCQTINVPTSSLKSLLREFLCPCGNSKTCLFIEFMDKDIKRGVREISFILFFQALSMWFLTNISWLDLDSIIFTSVYTGNYARYKNKLFPEPQAIKFSAGCHARCSNLELKLREYSLLSKLKYSCPAQRVKEEKSEPHIKAGR